MTEDEKGKTIPPEAMLARVEWVESFTAWKLWLGEKPSQFLEVYSKETDARNQCEALNIAVSRLLTKKAKSVQEACAKVVCDVCAQGVPIIKNHHCFGIAHDFGPEVVPSVRYLSCRARAIRAMEAK